MIDVFLTFLKLGLVSFGGPVAHLGYFREAFVERRRWFSDAAYADLVALCQFLPGPASSQVGFAVGVQRAGLLGGLAAWIGFTLPSAILMGGLAYGLVTLGAQLPGGLIQGLKLVAVAVVAHAVWSMARSLATGRTTATLAILGMAGVFLLPETAGVSRAIAQVLVIAVGAGAGLLFLQSQSDREALQLGAKISPAISIVSALIFFALVAGLPFLANTGAGLALADTMVRAGTLVFGGGHVVLPLLEAELVPPGHITEDAFLAGYGAAQAMPGPLFTFSAYVGGLFEDGGGGLGAWGSAIALVAIFLPGLLLVLMVLPLWDWLRARAWANGMLAGVNASVVGVLAAALYDPVFMSSVTGPLHLAWALAGFAAFAFWRLPAWALVILSGAGGAFFL